jgi:solute carrier family 25 S-adenosylmethionine transporter 26
VAYQGVADVFSRVVREEGAAALLSGLSARVFWISLGGFLFFGAYDAATTQLKKRGI